MRPRAVRLEIPYALLGNSSLPLVMASAYEGDGMSKPVDRSRWLGGVVSGLAAVLLILALGAAEAAEQAPASVGDADAGERLAREWCTACHYVGPGAAASDAAPAFAEIANNPAATTEGWRNWLMDPHPPMPNLALSRQEIDAIVAYLQSLKDH